MKSVARYPNPSAASQRALACLAAAGMIVALHSQSASAQTAPAPRAHEAAPYVVARAGVQIDSDLKLRRPDTVAPSRLLRDIDAKPGVTGELGAGYDFGGFRLEGTVGYGTAAVDREWLSDRTSTGSGRLKSLDLGVAGYVDLIPGARFSPFLGGGIGASRVDARVARLAPAVVATGTTAPRPGTPAARAAEAGRIGTRMDDRDWGFKWHLDAGAGYNVAPGTTLEIAGRYSRTTSLDLQGRSIAAVGRPAVTRSFEPRQSSASILLGLRQKF